MHHVCINTAYINKMQLHCILLPQLLRQSLITVKTLFDVHVVCLFIMCVLVLNFEHVQLSGVEPHMTRSEFIRAVNPHFFPPSVAVAVMFVFNDSVHDLWFR